MKIKIISVIIFFLVQVKCFSQEIVLQDDFTDRSKFIDLSELLLWYNDQDTISAFEITTFKDANNLEYQALTLKPEAIGEGGYNAGSSYASTCIDYQLPLYNRNFDTLIIEFDYLSSSLSGNGEGGRLGIAAMFHYPYDGPGFNDVFEQEKLHPFGRPAYNLRILNKKNNDNNGAYLFYGGGNDILGEFEKIGGEIWLPGFISGPGGFSPGQKENYPLDPVLETTDVLVSDQHWHHYTWMITPTHLQVYSRESNEAEDKNELHMNMLLPDGAEDEVVQQLNNFYQTSINQLPENYHFFERIEAIRFYFRSINNGYLANVKVSKTNHFEPAVLALATDTLRWLWEQQTELQIPVNIFNPDNLQASFQVVISAENPIIAGETFTFEMSSIGDYINLPFHEQYTPTEKTDTLQVEITPAVGWLSIEPDNIWILIEDGRITAIQTENTNPTFYPNPVTTNLETNVDQPMAYKLFDSQQRLVKEGVIVKLLPLDQLSPGIYYLRYQQGESLKVIKLIKN